MKSSMSFLVFPAAGQTGSRGLWRISVCVILLILPMLSSLTVTAMASEEESAVLTVLDELKKRPEYRVQLNECLATALQSNIDIALGRLDSRSQRTQIDGQRGVFDPLLSSSIGHTTSENKLSSEQSVIYGGLTSYNVEDLNVSVGISQKIVTGGSYSIGYEMDRTIGTFIQEPGEDDDGDGVPDMRPSQEYSSLISIGIRQPLLKNFGTTVNKGNITLAKLDNQRLYWTIVDTINLTVSFVHRRYWELVGAREELDVQEKALMLASDFLAQNQAKVDLGTLPPIDIVIARAEVANREQAVIIAVNDVRNSEDNLLQIMNVPADDPRWNSMLLPMTEIDFDPVNLEIEEAMSICRQHRPDYQRSLIEREQRELQLHITSNGAKPALDFTSSAALSNVEREYQKSLDGALGADSYRLYAGLSLEIPWANRAALAAKAQASLALERTDMTRKQLEDTIRLEVRQAIRQMQNLEKQVKAARVVLDLAQQKFDAEQMRYEIGVSTSYNVIEFQKDLAQAQSNLTQAKILFRLSVIDYYRVLGIILEKNGVTITADAMDATLSTP